MALLCDEICRRNDARLLRAPEPFIFGGGISASSLVLSTLIQLSAIILPMLFLLSSSLHITLYAGIACRRVGVTVVVSAMLLGYHWDCSDWVRRSHNPLPNITEVPGSEVPDSSSFHSNESNESNTHQLPTSEYRGGMCTLIPPLSLFLLHD